MIIKLVESLEEARDYDSSYDEENSYYDDEEEDSAEDYYSIDSLNKFQKIAFDDVLYRLISPDRGKTIIQDPDTGEEKEAQVWLAVDEDEDKDTYLVIFEEDSGEYVVHSAHGSSTDADAELAALNPYSYNETAEDAEEEETEEADGEVEYTTEPSEDDKYWDKFFDSDSEEEDEEDFKDEDEEDEEDDLL